MSIWEKYESEQRKSYIQFLQVYGALTNLFRQKKGDLIPYLDSKFQETVFAKIFKSQTVDIGNTPHDILSVFGNERIGIGIKTWMGSNPSFQKVMQLKRYQDEIKTVKEKSENSDLEELAQSISQIRNEKIQSDYLRLGLNEDKNIYHYVTRDEGAFTINESAYSLIDTTSLKNFKISTTAFQWSDGKKEYKFTFGDSQIWQKFDSRRPDTFIVEKFKVEIIEDPFQFLLDAYIDLFKNPVESVKDIVEVYLPLYSYQTKKVEEKSGLNAWNAAPKNTNSSTPRPLNEVYIPIPREFHEKYPGFFVDNIFEFEKERRQHTGPKSEKPELRFYLQLPNGKKIPSLITQSNMKSLQSGSNTERDEHGIRYGQSALGQWLLVDVLGLKERKLVTMEWLHKKGTDSVRLWRNKNDYSTINIDFAPIESFEKFMNNEPIDYEGNQ